MVDLSRRDVLKIGGGIAIFTGTTGGALTFLQGSAAGVVSVSMDVELSESASDGVDTPDGRLDRLELDLTRYDITYSNLTIVDQENASMDITISVDINNQSVSNGSSGNSTSGNNTSGNQTPENGFITESIHSETIPIDKPGDDSVIDVIREGPKTIENIDLLSIPGDSNQGFFTSADGNSTTYTITVSTSVQLNGIDMNDLDEENTVLNETASVDLTVQNLEGTVNSTITGVIDAE